MAVRGKLESQLIERMLGKEKVYTASDKKKQAYRCGRLGKLQKMKIFNLIDFNDANGLYDMMLSPGHPIMAEWNKANPKKGDRYVCWAESNYKDGCVSPNCKAWAHKKKRPKAGK